METQINHLFSLPYEVLKHELATNFDIITLLSFCKVSKRASKVCKDITFWQLYVRNMDHRDFQELIILLAKEGEETLFRKLIDNTDQLAQVIDKRTILWSYFNFAMWAAGGDDPSSYYDILNYILDHGDDGVDVSEDPDADNIEFLGKLRDYNPSPQEIVENMKNIKEIVHKIGKGRPKTRENLRNLTLEVNKVLVGFEANSYFYEYLVNILYKDQYKWLIGYNDKGNIADEYFFIPALLNINDMDTVISIVNFYDFKALSDNIWRTISCYGSLKQIYAVYDSIEPTAIPIGKNEDLFYVLASKNPTLIFYGCYSTDPYKYIEFLKRSKLWSSKHIKDAIDHGRENGYTYWSNMVEEYLDGLKV